MACTEYVIRKALADEANGGWVWIDGKVNAIGRRKVMLIENRCADRSVYVEARVIDQNFIDRYNERPNTVAIALGENTLVMSEWYRDALGITKTTSADNKSDRTPLKVSQPNRLWGSIRACCHHPDLAIRVATRLGILGTWLGFLGATLGAISFQSIAPFKAYILGTIVVLALPCLLIGRGTK